MLTCYMPGMSNSIAIVDKEIASPLIEGVDFGANLWVIARSPKAVLIWKKGHSWSVNGNQRYSGGALFGIPDRGPGSVGRMEYSRLWEGEGRRFGWQAPTSCALQIDGLFGIPGVWRQVVDVVRSRKTLLIEGGGNQLRPPGLYGHAYAEWRAIHGTGFLMLPEGMTEHDACRHKLGWAPKG